MLKLIANKHSVFIISVITGAIILCFWAFYNQYPLYFSSDTAMYLEAAFYNSVGPDRPIMYGLLMYFVSFKANLWLVVFLQSLILSYLLLLYFKHFTLRSNYTIPFIFFIVIITFFSGAGFNVGWLMPDIFTSVSILGVGLLIFVKSLKLHEIILVSIFIFLGITVHNSHFFICLALVGIVLFSYAIIHIRNTYLIPNLKFSRLIIVFILLISANLFTASVHNSYGAGFKGPKGGEIFLFGNMVEMGVVNTYLEEECPSYNYEICPYRDTLPNNFLWASNSPIQQMGGWQGCSKEFKQIIVDIVSKPKYLKDFIFKSVVYTLKQLMHFDTGEATMPTQRIEHAFSFFYPNQYGNYIKSKQVNGKLSFNLVNYGYTILMCFSLFFIVWSFFEDKLSTRYRLFIIFFLLPILINAAVCAIFSGVYFRYQARVAWLMLLPVYIFLVNNNFFIHQKPTSCNLIMN